MPTLAQQLLDLLLKNGIEIIYGVTGDVLFPFFDALSRRQDIRFIATSHEANAAFMASYQAKLTGKTAVCVATSGPGTANLVNGLADAYFDKAPVLAITGQVASQKLGTGTKQDINQQKLLQAVTFSSELATSGEAALTIVARALEIAIYHQTVTHVSIPMDLFSRQCGSGIPVIDTRVLSGQGNGYSGQLDESVAALQNAQNPLIVIGTGNKELGNLAARLGETLGAAIIVAQQAKGLIPDDHPRVLGGIGEAYVPGLLNDVDCILMVGSASYEKKYLPADKNTIQLVAGTGSIDYQQANLAVMGKIKDMLEAILYRLKPAERQAWQEKIEQEKNQLRNMIGEQKNNNSSPIHPARLMATLSDLLPADAVIVCDIGGYIHWFDSYFQAKEQTVLISSHWRSMGSGLPGALGASLQRPKQKVMALVGDGGLLMCPGELATAVKYNIPVTIIVANNKLYEYEKLRMEHQGLNPFGVDPHMPDFAALARSFGLAGKTITTGEDLEPILRESIDAAGAVLVDVQLSQAPLPFIK